MQINVSFFLLFYVSEAKFLRHLLWWSCDYPFLDFFVDFLVGNQGMKQQRFLLRRRL